MHIIRKATQRDAAALAQIAEQTFRSTFAGANSAGDMALHCRKNFGRKIQAKEIDDPSIITLVCEEELSLIGFAQLRRGQAPDFIAASTPIEIQRLYLVGEWHGKGVAQALMEACIEEALRSHSDAIWLGVWEQNPRAISFYNKCGFLEAGEHRFQLGSDMQRDVVMVKPLDWAQGR